MIKADQSLPQALQRPHRLHMFPSAVTCTEGFKSKIPSIQPAARGFRLFREYRAATLLYRGKLSLFPQTSQKNQKIINLPYA